MLEQVYAKLGSVFILNLLNKNISFLIRPEVSVHFFKASETGLSLQVVYWFNVLGFHSETLATSLEYDFSSKVLHLLFCGGSRALSNCDMNYQTLDLLWCTLSRNHVDGQLLRLIWNTESFADKIKKSNDIAGLRLEYFPPMISPEGGCRILISQ
ncbi:hypothetical protein L1987_20073 [Smallanthus sonchifolius]|uniref:Uncharacterized protein n=1 Tax=Smallanthus sonchifolius TaxID=185202 RepID=A0ACB9ISI6_9ASTR|nr:hypothetical protein L1987_20073 [Smallanthus sonchifolius]